MATHRRITCRGLTTAKPRPRSSMPPSFPDSQVGATDSAPSDFLGGEEGNESTVEFSVLGQQCSSASMGGPNFTPNEAVSFMVVT